MKQMGVFEAKTNFSQLLNAVEQGEQIIITKYGRAVAKLIPISQRDSDGRVQAIAKIKELRKGNILGDLDWKELRDWGR